jgi:hypothetical protein
MFFIVCYADRVVGGGGDIFYGRAALRVLMDAM